MIKTATALSFVAGVAFLNRNLIDIWKWSPYDQFAVIAFGVWLLVVAFFPAKKERDSAVFEICGVATLLAGLLFDVHLFFQLALIFAVVCVPKNTDWRKSAIVFPAAVTWLPVSGLALSTVGFAPQAVALIRLVGVIVILAAVGAFAIYSAQKRNLVTQEGLDILRRVSKKSKFSP